MFQPIVWLDGRSVLGHEAILHPLGSGALDDVRGLHAAAQRLSLSRDLDVQYAEASIAAARALPAAQPVFLNIGLGTLIDPDNEVTRLRSLLAHAGRQPSSVVLELSESINDLRRFEAAFACFRSAGFRFALKEIGQGHSTLEALSVVNPDFLKVSRRLTAMDSPSALATLQALVAFAGANAAVVIVEGVDDDGSLDRLIGLGIPCGQGVALGAPAWLHDDAQLSA